MSKKLSGLRRIAGDILLALFGLLTIEVVTVMPAKISAVVLKSDYRELFIYEIILCAVLLLFALDVRFDIFNGWEPVILKATGLVFRVVVILLSAVILFFCGKVMIGGLIDNAGQADHVIVLGLALENGNATPDLISRLETARDYLEEYPEARLILTGGNAEAQGKTEARVMRDILTEWGVSDDRLILEDRAQNTQENFGNIAMMIPPEEPVVMISSDYHMDRAVRNATESGFSNIMRHPAPSGFFTYGANVLSEVILDLNDLLE